MKKSVHILLLLLFLFEPLRGDEILPDDAGHDDPDRPEEHVPKYTPPAAPPVVKPMVPPVAPSPERKTPKIDPLLLVHLPGGPGGGREGSGGGSVLGLRWRSTGRRLFRAFLKVPYAQPPLGPLRYKIIK